MKKYLDELKKKRMEIDKKKKESELLTYTDGKVKPIQKPLVENEEDKPPLLQSLRLEEAQKEKEKNGLSKGIKLLVALVLIVLAIWICIEIKNIIASPNQVAQDEQTQQTTSSVLKNGQSNTNPAVEEEPVQNDKSTVSKLFTPDEEEAMTFINLADETNKQMLLILENNNTAIAEYQNQYLNRISLQERLGASVPDLEAILTAFASYKQNYLELDLGELYEASYQRYDSLLQYATTQFNVSKEYNDSFSSIETEYVEADELYSQLQRESILAYLDSADIAYSINPVTNQIEYTVK